MTVNRNVKRRGLLGATAAVAVAVAMIALAGPAMAQNRSFTPAVGGR